MSKNMNPEELRKLLAGAKPIPGLDGPQPGQPQMAEQFSMMQGPPTPENPSGQIMFKHVVVVGFTPELQVAMTNGIAKAVIDALGPEFASVGLALKDARDRLENIHSRITRLQKRLGENPKDPSAKEPHD